MTHCESFYNIAHQEESNSADLLQESTLFEKVLFFFRFCACFRLIIFFSDIYQERIINLSYFDSTAQRCWVCDAEQKNLEISKNRSRFAREQKCSKSERNRSKTEQSRSKTERKRSKNKLHSVLERLRSVFERLRSILERLCSVLERFCSVLNVLNWADSP